MDCSAVFKVTAEAYGQVIKSALFFSKCKQVCKRLCWVEVSTVACVDNRAISSECRSLYLASGRVTHYHDIGIAGNYLCGILDILSLCNGRSGRIVKAYYRSPKTEHSGLERHLRSC